MKRGGGLELLDYVDKAKQGDQEALLQLIMAKRDEYYRLAYVYLKNQEDALDALEDMIVIIYEKLGGLKKSQSFYSWSKVILVNCCKRIIKNRRKVVYLDVLPEIADDGLIKNKQHGLEVEEYLQKLNPKHQEVLRLRYLADLEYDTIAQILKIPLGTVKSRISLGLRKLQALVGGEMDE
jgi:RNA polymerase sigma factor (sigma-70 family)